jgi:hypothetical protein
MCHWVHPREALREVANHENATIEIDWTPGFSNRGVENKAKMLTEIDEITKYLETSLLTLEQGWFALDSLINKVADKKMNVAHRVFYQCHLGTNYIVIDADIVPGPHFESGVIKI